jgi:hypothetical protein
VLVGFVGWFFVSLAGWLECWGSISQSVGLWVVQAAGQCVCHLNKQGMRLVRETSVFFWCVAHPTQLDHTPPENIFKTTQHHETTTNTQQADNTQTNNQHKQANPHTHIQQHMNYKQTTNNQHTIKKLIYKTHNHTTT